MTPCFMPKRPPRRGNCPARHPQTHWRSRIPTTAAYQRTGGHADERVEQF
jgi:hypothetical protein